MDSLPNFVCQLCWQTTEAFHELYQKSKTAQEKYLNPMIKIEIDTTEQWHENIERDFTDESHIDENTIKFEPNIGKIIDFEFKYFVVEFSIFFHIFLKIFFFLSKEYADVLDSQNHFDDLADLSDRDTLNDDIKDDQISNGIETSTGLYYEKHANTIKFKWNFFLF